MRSLTLIAALLSSSLCLVSMAVRASAPNLAEALARGDVAYAAEDWTGYAEIYRRLSQANPGNGLYWYRLGLGERGLQHAEYRIEAQLLQRRSREQLKRLTGHGTFSGCCRLRLCRSLSGAHHRSASPGGSR